VPDDAAPGGTKGHPENPKKCGGSKKTGRIATAASKRKRRGCRKGEKTDRGRRKLFLGGSTVLEGKSEEAVLRKK